MRVGFFHAGDSAVHTALAARLIASIRRAMPDVSISHFTDATTAAIPGGETVRGAGGPLALACLEAYAACEGEWLFLDSDVIVQQDVRHVFDRPFDVAVADRTGTLLPKEMGTTFMTRMPYNKGAVFSRSPAFWREAGDWLRTRPAKRQAWMGDQEAMNTVIASERYRVAVLPSAYNYPPKTRDEDVSDKAVVHFKGARKAWALGRAA